MGKLQLYILRQLFWATVAIIVALACIVWLTQSLRFVDMIVSRGLSLTAFISFTLLLLPTFLAIIGPIALFVATLFIYNKMMHDRELVILSASGLGPGFISRPAILLALVLVALGYFNTLYLMPTAFREFKDLQRAFRADLSHLFVQEGVFNSIIDGVTVFVRERSGRGRFKGIVVHDERDPEIPVTIMAEQGAILSDNRGSRVVMTKGNRQEVSRKDGRLTLLHFDSYTLDLAALDSGGATYAREPRERFLHELFLPEPASGPSANYQRFRMEGLSRLAMPLLYPCFVLVALGALLSGGFDRRGHLRRILVAACVVAVVQLGFFGAMSVGTVMPELETLILVLPVAAIAIFAVLLARSGRTMNRRRMPAGPGVPQ